jgi:hypothetical protein
LTDLDDGKNYAMSACCFSGRKCLHHPACDGWDMAENALSFGIGKPRLPKDCHGAQNLCKWGLCK